MASQAKDQNSRTVRPEHVPVIPGVIADVLCEAFYRSETPGEYEQYRRDLECFVRTRLKIFVTQKAQESRWVV